MPWFRVLIEGENFKIKFAERVESVGFYANRFVEVHTSDEAEAAAVEMIRSDEKLGLGVMNDEDDPPMIHVVEIHKVSKEEVPEAEQGFTFFPSDT